MSTDAMGYTLGIMTLGMSMVAAKYRNMLLTLGTAALWIVFLNFMLANNTAGLPWLEILIIAVMTFIAAYGLIFLVNRRSSSEGGYFGILERSKQSETKEPKIEEETSFINDEKYRATVHAAVMRGRARRAARRR